RGRHGNREAPTAGQRDDPRHALSTAAELHHARSRARPLPRPNREVRWQGARTRARGQGLRLDPGRGGGVSATEHFVGDFRRFVSRTERRVPAWVAEVREAAISRFAEIGFPTTREEDWKYTNVSRLVGVPYRAALESPERRGDGRIVGSGLLAGATASRLVFVNGRFVEWASQLGRLPAGVRVESLATALAADGEIVERHLSRYAAFDRNGFTALSTAFLDDGAFVFLPDEIELERPIELVFVSTGDRGEAVAYPRLLAVCGRQSRATL